MPDGSRVSFGRRNVRPDRSVTQIGGNAEGGPVGPSGGCVYDLVQSPCSEGQCATLQMRLAGADNGLVYTAPVNPDPSVQPLRGRRYHFRGVGGSGMTPLAILASSLGASVSGSDRNHDRGLDLPSFGALRAAGVTYVLANFGGSSRASLQRFAREIAPAFS